MEEDAGKNIHSDDPSRKVSYVDFNRTGVPLLEIVSEPDLSSADEAWHYLTTLRQIMKYIDASDCNMEEGSLRCDVNISLKPAGSSVLGNKVEIKNMNSFRAVKAAIEYEIGRQTGMLDDNERIAQETRLWDPDRSRTFSMRSKEEAHDYRYFPDPDLAPVMIDEAYIDSVRATMPELPKARVARFAAQYDIPVYDAGVLCSCRQLADYYEETLAEGCNPKKTSNWIMSELLALVDDPEKISDFTVTPAMLAELLLLIDNNTISGKIAKTVFADMVASGKGAAQIVKEKGLVQVTDTSEISRMIDDVLAENAQSVEDFRAGKDRAFGFLVGQVMKVSKGKANPQLVNDMLREKLNS
jgi:aspartyl-tRNA(Asn)/glutamyl-tRNA(Gln) amidotransferase subunit B